MSDENPCAAGCLLGLGERCSNQPQPWRPYPLPIVCRRIHRDGDEAFRAQTFERSHWTEPPPAPPAPEPASEADQVDLRLAETCVHRDCLGCGCRGCRCELSRQLVKITDCLACVRSRL